MLHNGFYYMYASENSAPRFVQVLEVVQKSRKFVRLKKNATELQQYAVPVLVQEFERWSSSSLRDGAKQHEVFILKDAQIEDVLSWGSWITVKDSMRVLQASFSDVQGCISLTEASKVVGIALAGLLCVCSAFGPTRSSWVRLRHGGPQ